jgi:hypothetical protein
MIIARISDEFYSSFNLGRRISIGIPMAKVECVLLDITGVLKEGDAPIAGSIEAVKK